MVRLPTARSARHLPPTGLTVRPLPRVSITLSQLEIFKERPPTRPVMGRLGRARRSSGLFWRCSQSVLLLPRGVCSGRFAFWFPPRRAVSNRKVSSSFIIVEFQMAPVPTVHSGVVIARAVPGHSPRLAGGSRFLSRIAFVLMPSLVASALAFGASELGPALHPAVAPGVSGNHPALTWLPRGEAVWIPCRC